jgi:hypothetical protein
MLSSSSAWAVGFVGTSNGFATLTERWNGSAWTVLPSPNIGAQSFLLGVKAFSANDVWAVGSHNVPGSLNFETLVERWNGSSWSIVPSPNPQPAENQLLAIDGVSSTNLWAVGYALNHPDGVRQPLVVRFNGSSWATVPVPSALDATLEGVVALSANDVWAVGWKFSTQLFWHVPYAIHWNGSTWSEVPVPSPSPQGGRFADVVALSPTNVYAFGQFNSGGIRTLAMRWNGTQWGTEPVTSPGTVANLWAATAVAPSTIFAVGNTTQLRNGVLTPSRTFAVRTGNG